MYEVRSIQKTMLILENIFFVKYNPYFQLDILLLPNEKIENQVLFVAIM